MTFRDDFPVPIERDIDADELLQTDIRRALGAIVCGVEYPVSVTHALTARPGRALTALDITAVTGMNASEVDSVLSSLRDMNWVLPVEQNGFAKFVLDRSTILREEFKIKNTN